MITADSVYRIGRLGKTHGLKGELVFFCDDDIIVFNRPLEATRESKLSTRRAQRFGTTDANYVILRLDGIFVPFFIEDYRLQSGEKALIKFDSISTIEQATPLAGAEVFFPIDGNKEKEGRPLKTLIGFAISDNTSHTATAPIVAIHDDADNPLFELSDGTLIPIVEDWIEGIDHSKRLINMTLPEGLLSV